MGSLKPCRCCGEKTIEEYDSYEICGVCRWHDNDIQSEDPDYNGGPNRGLSLNEARKAYKERLLNAV